jgi:glycosyltransferase involved in cell wall biosynthesis
MEKILEMISSSQYRERIEYMGYLEDDEYYALLGECDILCMTRVASKFAQAGFPFKLGEYLATGRAVVASNVGDVGLYLADRKNALIVEPDSSESIAKALEFLISNPDEAKKIGHEGRKLAKEKFNAKTLTINLKEVLKRT